MSQETTPPCGSVVQYCDNHYISSDRYRHWYSISVPTEPSTPRTYEFTKYIASAHDLVVLSYRDRCAYVEIFSVAHIAYLSTGVGSPAVCSFKFTESLRKV